MYAPTCKEACKQEDVDRMQVKVVKTRMKI